MATVVILLSDKRSGSTFLEKALVAHPQIRHVNYTSHTYNETHYWLKAAQLLAMPEEMFSGRRYSRSYGNRERVRNSLLSNIRQNVPDFESIDDDRELIFQGWEALCERFALPVFIEKSPHHANHWAVLELILQWAEKTQHRVKIIALVRNPMSVMYSAYKLFHTSPEQRQYGWFETNRNLILMESLQVRSELFWVRYEDLVTKPNQVFGCLCRFLRVEFSSALGRGVHSNSRNIWRDDEQFTFQLDPAVKRLALHFGYSEVDLFNPHKPRKESSQTMLSWARRLLYHSYSRLYNLYKRATIK